MFMALLNQTPGHCNVDLCKDYGPHSPGGHLGFQNVKLPCPASVKRKYGQ